MTQYTIEYDLTELKKLADNFAKNMTEAALPNTAAAFQDAVKKTENMWRDALWYKPGISPKIIETIKSKRNRDFDYSVYSDSRRLEELNNGSKAVEYDMKLTHPYGKKSRVSKKGIPYLIIPFRWRTPGQSEELAHKEYFSGIIPTKIYNTRVKGMHLTEKNPLKSYFEKNFRGENIKRNGYDWGDRLTEDQAWNDRSVGMVRAMDDSNPNRLTGTYFTFRIISAKSPAGSWIYRKKAKPGTNYMSELEQKIRPEVERIISEGIRADNEDYKRMMLN